MFCTVRVSNVAGRVAAGHTLLKGLAVGSRPHRRHLQILPVEIQPPRAYYEHSDQSRVFGVVLTFHCPRAQNQPDLHKGNCFEEMDAARWQAEESLNTED